MSLQVITGQPVAMMPVETLNWSPDWENRLKLLAEMNEISVNPVKSLECSCGHLAWPKQFVVTSAANEICYSMFEESSNGCRTWCRLDRPFIMHVRDKNEQDVLRIKHDFQCCGNCGGFCCTKSCANITQRVTIFMINNSSEEKLGTVAEYPNVGCTNLLDVIDANNVVVLRLEASSTGCNNIQCGHDVDFKITNPSGHQVGTIKYLWIGPGLISWLFSAPYSISLTEHIPEKQKALLLGAVLLIEYRYFDIQRDTRYSRCQPDV